jgi:hypothetical protein
MNDLHLKFKFVDRGGSKVYDMYDAEDRITLLEPLGELRINQEGDTVCRDYKVEGDGTG